MLFLSSNAIQPNNLSIQAMVKASHKKTEKHMEKMHNGHNMFNE
jgi:hypothetical protein